MITGASMGIGRAVAYELAAKGNNLLLVARSRDKLDSLASELKLSNAVDVRIVVEDLSDRESAPRIFQYCQDQSIRVDCMINCAGFSYAGEFAGIPLTELHQMMAVNMVSLVSLTRLFLPSMIACGRGTIINVASIGGFQGVPYLALYSATKSFVITFTEALHDEVRNSGIRTFAVCPGFIDTNFYDRAGHNRKKIILPISHTDVVVKAVSRGLKSGRIRIFPSALDWLLVFLQRFMPRIVVVKLSGFLAGAKHQL